jgi:hypothetical protein
MDLRFLKFLLRETKLANRSMQCANLKILRSPVWDSCALARCCVVPFPVRPSTPTWKFLAAQTPQIPGDLTVDHGTATAYSNWIASASGD